MITKEWIDELLENTFGEHEKHAREMMKRRIGDFEDMDLGRGYLARQLLYAPLDREDVTSDDEAFADAGARILSREDFEQVVAVDRTADALRSALVAAQKEAQVALLRSESASKLAGL